jgi:hypothetical protein
VVKKKVILRRVDSPAAVELEPGEVKTMRVRKTRLERVITCSHRKVDLVIEFII